MGKKNLNNFWTVKPICTKLDTQHQRRTLNRPTTGNREIWKARWPPAAILKFTETWVTPEPFVQFSPNLARSFVLTPPWHRKYQNRHFSKSKMADDEKLKYTKNWITSKRFVMHKIWCVSSTSHPEQACGPKMSKFIIQNGRLPPFRNLLKVE